MEHVDEIMTGYFVSLFRELEMYYAEGVRGPLRTVFIGGGTPTCPDSGFILWLLSYLAEKWEFAYGWEATMEANPENLIDYPLDKIAAAGVNRLSVGVQSTFDHHLAYLERDADAEKVKRALDRIAADWRGRLSFDIMYGIPGQTIDELYSTIELIADCNPDHVSAYQLTPERGTTFGRRVAKGQAIVPSDGESLALAEFVEAQLARHGFHRYEISNYAKRDGECRHNIAVWRGEEYLGVGVGAVGYIGGARYENVRTFDEYFKLIGDGKLPRASEDKLEPAHRARERVAFGLRMLGGVQIAGDSIMSDAFGTDSLLSLNDANARAFMKTLESLIDDDLLSLEEGVLRLTPAGLRVHNYVAASILYGM